MRHFERLLRARRAFFIGTRRALLLLGPAALLRAQIHDPRNDTIDGPRDSASDNPIRLPNGKSQQDELAKADYQSNLKDARELLSLAKSFEEDFEKDERFVVSLSSLKKLDDIEKLSRRIRGRLTRY